MQIMGSEHLYTDNFDPEGILAIISATALVLLGLAYGRTLQIRGGNWKTLKLFFTAAILSILIGVLASSVLPVVKQLWTSSFILILAGLEDTGFL